MTLQSEAISGNQIIAMLEENNPLAWENLYDKYASVMYGLICNLTEDKLLAEEILMNAFLELKQKQILSKIKYALLPIIMRYTHSYTIEYLKNIRITEKTFHPQKETELIHLFTTQCSSLKVAASILNITVKETKKRLQVEFLNLRIQNNTPEIVQLADDINVERLLPV
ncbi:MAG: hypothetical protein ABIY35_06485 [Chitinophagaceae bacterium]